MIHYTIQNSFFTRIAVTYLAGMTGWIAFGHLTTQQFRLNIPKGSSARAGRRKPGADTNLDR
jgi:hypothetical protein